VLVRYGKCCNPVPGDGIVGYITRGRGVTVHTIGCDKILGIDPEGIPRDLPEARATWSLIARRNFGPTPEGKALARDHLAFLDDLVPGQILSGLNLALSRWLMGPDVAGRCLDLPRERLWIRVLERVRPLLGLARGARERT